MTAKEFLSKYYPKLIVRKYRTRKIGGESVYCCRYGTGQIWLSDGKTGSEAVNKAALDKAKEIVRAKCPDAGCHGGSEILSKGRKESFFIYRYSSNGFAGDICHHKNEIRAWILAAEKIEKEVMK